jgi:small GTP-binding protein
MTNDHLPPFPDTVIGRRKELAELKAQLLAISAEDTSAKSIIAIRGWPGVGKTTLAIMLAHDLDIQAKFPDGVFWLTLGSSPDLLAKLTELGRALDSEQLRDASTVQQGKDILAKNFNDKNFLLILDDVWELAHITPFWVDGRNCETLITTRIPDLAEKITDPSHIYVLHAFSVETSLRLLGSLAPEVVTNYPTETRELVNILEGLPLAIQVAGRLLQSEMSTGFGVRELIKELGEGSRLLNSKVPSNSHDLAKETTSTISALFLSSLNKLDEDTRDCYAYLGVFAPKPAMFDIEAMAFVWQVKDPLPIVHKLLSYGLLEYNSEIDRYEMPALLVTFARSLLEDSSIPSEIKNIDSSDVVISYFSQEKDPLNEAKTLIVGQGSVGKTSLARRLIHDDFQIDESKTEGITINRWFVHNQSEVEILTTMIQLNIWDFGGQEIMHATHQFFLTKRSLYLLVLDARLTQEENRVEYWLKIIQSFGGESPVLIVGNKIDQHPLDIDRTSLQKKYSNIVGILETSAATGAGIEELKAAITKRVNNLPHVHDLLPKTWFTVKTKLEELGREKNYISHDKYFELCAEHEVSEETSQRTLIGFLHDLGVVLHFQDDPRLEALGILNPEWVTNGVYKIINAKSLFKNRGVLTIAMLNDILNLPEYPHDKRLFIVDMMKKFELCYDLEPDKTFLVPDLLPKDEPALDFHGIAAFEYHYPVLPSSVMTRFIVRMNQKIDNNQVWRSGVLLKIGENRALVKADVEDRTVRIAIDGLEHTRRDALAAIRYQLDEIHASIKGLNPEKYVPVPGAVHARPLKYDYLLKLERAGEETWLVEDGEQLKKVNVSQMLNGVESEYERKQYGNVTNIHIGGDVKDSNIIVGDENKVNHTDDDQKDDSENP